MLRSRGSLYYQVRPHSLFTEKCARVMLCTFLEIGTFTESFQSENQVVAEKTCATELGGNFDGRILGVVQVRGAVWFRRMQGIRSMAFREVASTHVVMQNAYVLLIRWWLIWASHALPFSLRWCFS